jgi:hypothetical protein
MSDELSAIEKIVKEVLIDLMNERVISTSIQASLMRGVKASPSTTRGAEPSRPSAEKRTKHRDDLDNVKLIPTIFPDYISPHATTISHDSLPRYFEYTMVTAYLPKGIRAVRAQ